MTQNLTKTPDRTILWSGKFLDTHTTIISLVSDPTYMSVGMVSKDLTYTIGIRLQLKDSTPAEIVSNVLAAVKENYLAAIIGSKNELIRAGEKIH